MNPTKIIALLVITFLAIGKTFSQEKFTLSGTITDLKSNETLIGVNVYIPELKSGTTTNEYGFYSITLPKGNYTIVVSYIGFQTIETYLTLSQNTKNNLALFESGETLDEVIISEKTTTNTKKAEMSVNKLSIATI